MGILGGCEKYEKCVKDETSSRGGRCILLHAEVGVTKAHRKLPHWSTTSTCSGSYLDECIPCTMSGSTLGKKCDGRFACQGVNDTNVSCGSCNDNSACYRAAGPIGEGSCNGKSACYQTAGPIGESSCNGVRACILNYCELIVNLSFINQIHKFSSRYNHSLAL